MKCFYHSGDFDGLCSGAIIKHKYPQCEMIGINYGHDFPWESIKEYENIFMIDFTLQPFSEMQQLNSICSLIWIDHHASSIYDAKKCQFQANGEQILDIDKAACELTWEYIYSSNIPKVVYLLGRHDVWDHTDPDTLPFQYGMRMESNTWPDNQDFWSQLFADKHTSTIIDRGRIALEYETLQSKKYCKSYAFETSINGYKAICINRGMTNSKAFDSINTNEYDLMITFVRLRLPIKKWTVSLYTVHNNIDCSAIAKTFGGGGHKKAAGFQCSELPFEH